MKALSRDPVMKRHLKAADEIGKRIVRHIEKMRKDDPELANKMDALDKIVGM